MLLNCLAVGVGGFLGAVSRYLLGSALPTEPGGFPVITLLINFIGSFLISVLTECGQGFLPVSQRTSLFLKTGLCGGFTTFSTFSLETVQLFENGKAAMGVCYAAASVGLCLAGVWLGQLAVRFAKQHLL